MYSNEIIPASELNSVFVPYNVIKDSKSGKRCDPTLNAHFDKMNMAFYISITIVGNAIAF